MPNLLALSLASLVTLGLAGCASDDDGSDETADEPVAVEVKEPAAQPVRPQALNTYPTELVGQKTGAVSGNCGGRP